MACLSGFELYSRWVPLFLVRRQTLCSLTVSFAMLSTSSFDPNFKDTRSRFLSILNQIINDILILVSLQWSSAPLKVIKIKFVLNLLLQADSSSGQRS